MASKRLSFIAIIACAALSFAAVGCGDDDDDKTPTADAGGNDSGTQPGTDSGTDAGGGTPSVAQCTTDTVARTVDQACAACACEKATKAAAECAADSNCWPLILCIGENCPADSSCVASTCVGNISGLGKAQAIGTTLKDASGCASVCVAAPGTDGGTDDGGA